MNRKLLIRAIISLAVLILAVGAWHWWRVSRPPKARQYVIAKIYARAPLAGKREAAPPLPAVAKKYRSAKVAIVIDDFGYNKNNLEALFAINKPVTLSILPDLRYSRQIAGLARSRGYEAILHLPLEAKAKEVKEEADTIRSGMSEKEITERLDKEILSVPGSSGVSNHMGSKSTEDKELMSVIFRQLKKRGLYFFDSLTSEKSVCREAARTVGIRYARRDMFLDNVGDVDSVEKQLLGLRKLAFKRGRAIAICHDRKNTMAALAKAMPGMERDGIEFVSLSEMVK